MIIVAYFIGSISSAILVCKSMHLPDPRLQGSRNPGATNVLRIGGKWPALFTLLGDFLKGLVPVLLARLLGFDAIVIALSAFAAFFGHLFPIFFGFQGGKGVATMIGCLLVLSLPAGMCWIATWLIMAYLFRYSSLAALVASILAPVYIGFFSHNLTYAMTTLIMSLLLIYRHRNNIENLLRGKEKKIGKNN